MRFLLAIFLFFAIAFPALAFDAFDFDKEWREASPGWYLRITYNAGIGWYPRTRSTDWWAYNSPISLPPEDVLALIESDIDQRSKPVFVRKQRISYFNPPPPGCLQDVFVFRVDGKERNIYDPTASDFYFQKCRRSNKWELLRKSCGNENIGACFSDKFSKKFPFDILFSLPSTQITCPKVNFFGSEFDLCFIYEAMRLMKYPIAASLIIKLFFAL